MPEAVQTREARALHAYNHLKKYYLLANEDLADKKVLEILNKNVDLIESGDLNLEIPYSRTNLTFLLGATWYGKKKLMAWLLDHGSNVAAMTKDGDTAGHLVVRRETSAEETQDLISFLVDRGLDLTITNVAGEDCAGIANFSLEKFINKLTGKSKKKKLPPFKFTDAQIESCFKCLDLNGTGSVSFAELKVVMRDPRVRKGTTEVSNDCLEEMFGMVDESGDGQIDLKEFTNFIKGKINGSMPPDKFEVAKARNQMSVAMGEGDHNKDVGATHIDFIYAPRVTPQVEPKDVLRICQAADLNFSKFQRILQNDMMGELHSYVEWDTYLEAMKPQGGLMKGIKKNKKKLVKSYKKVFDAFCEEGEKQCNTRLMGIAFGGVLGQMKSKFAGKEQLTRQRGEFCFLMLDVNKTGYLTFAELQWLLKSASLYQKPQEEVDKKAQLLLTAAGARGHSDRISEKSFLEVVARFPNIVFPKVVT